MDNEAREMFQLIIGKLDRQDQRMDHMEQQMEGMWHEINACTMNLSAVNMLLKNNVDLDARIIQLEEWQERCRA